jgi:CRP/FNR family transcriptional regulator, anaerobic regulatory protein
MKVLTVDRNDFSVRSPTRPSVRHANIEPSWSGLQEVMDLLLFKGQGGGPDQRQLFQRRRVKAGKSVFGMGQVFDGLYVVRLGALKTVITHPAGSELVLSFSMRGDLLGSDGVCENRYCTEAVALTDCEVIRLPAAELFSPGHCSNELERMAYWAISRDIVKDHRAHTLSHAATSEMRVARFLLLQSTCFAAIGYSARRFTLPMTRRDIGNYLSITLETVSRALTTLDRQGIVEVVNREITIHSPDALQAYAGYDPEPSRPLAPVHYAQAATKIVAKPLYQDGARRSVSAAAATMGV